MSGYISVDSLIEFANNHINKTIDANDIARFPRADAKKVVHAKIVKTGRRYPYCSECDTSLERSYFKYCPYCGAIFDEDKSRIVDDAISEIEMLEELLGEEDAKI